MTLRDTARKFFPPWMLDRVAAGLVNGWKYIYSFLVMGDLLIQFAIEGVLAKFPGYCPAEALPIIGRDRRITRGLAETDDSYATRLIGWLDAWKRAGSAYAILDQIAAYLGTPGTLRIVTANGTWWTRNPDGSRERVVTLPTKNWDWDGEDDLWARFWVILYADDYGWTTDGVWGTPGEVWGDDGTGWGLSNVPWQVGQDLRGIIAEWKSAASICKNIVISLDSSYPDPATPAGAPMPIGNWGSAYQIVAGTAVPVRDSRLLFGAGAPL